MKFYTFELVCRKCGDSLEKRLTQFDSLPTCTKCDNEMLVNSVRWENEGKSELRELPPFD